MMRARALLVCAVAAALSTAFAIVAGAASIPLEDFSGSLSVASAAFGRQTEASVDAGLLQVGHGDGANVTVSGSFEGLVVQWHRNDCKGAGESDSSSGSAYFACQPPAEGSRSFEEGTVVFRPREGVANVMLDADEGPMVLVPPGTMGLNVSDGSTWRAGLQIQLSRASAPGSQPDDWLNHEEPVDAGRPIAGGVGALEAGWSGNGSLYVWGGALEVRTSDGARHLYESGVWFSNETGSQLQPNGVARDEHRQFLTIGLTRGVIDVHVADGPWRAIGRAVNASTTGTMVLREALGVIAGASGQLTVHGGEARLTGSVRAGIRPEPDPDRLALDLIGSSVAVDSTAGTFQNAPVASVSSFPWIWVVVVGAAAVLAVATVHGWRRRAALRRLGPLRLAERHIEAGRYRAALSAGERAVARDPGSPDALMCVAVALLKLGRLQELAERMEPAARDGEAPVLAYIVARAHAGMHHDGVAAQWAMEAARDPEVRSAVLTDSSLEAARKQDPFRRWLRLAADPSYG